MSVIRTIEEFHGEKVKGTDDWPTFDGWRVVTDDQTVTVAVSDGQDCCETWGYFSTDHNPQRFVGARLLRVERVEGTVPESVEEYGIDDGAALFVNLVTNWGTFQLAVYNSHNGYYGHEAVVISRDLNVSETL